MNIALVSVEVHKHGGVPLCVAYLLEHLRCHHRVTVFCHQLADVDMADLRVYHIPLFSKPQFLRPLAFALYFNVLFLCLRLFRGERFDIVHTAGEEGALPANVVTSHFCQRRELDALREGLITLPMQTWGQKLRALDYNIHRRLGCLLEWSIFGRQNARLRTVVSSKMKQDFRHYYGAVADAIVVIPNGVDVEEFHPCLQTEYRRQIRELHGLNKDDFVLFFIGGDWERKGLRYAIESLAYVPDPKVKLLVVGIGDEAHHRLLVKEFGVEERVIFVTRFVRQSRYYAASDVFLFPTLYEPFGLVILEAMATGLPVVTSAAAGAADCVEDGVDGFLLENVRDARQLAEKVDLLFTDVRLRQTMGEQARKKAESMSWGSIGAIYQKAYQALVQRTGT